jgi:hypothetical protein
VSGLGAHPERRGRQLANLRQAPAPPAGNQRALRHAGYAEVARGRLDVRTRHVFDELERFLDSEASAPLDGLGEAA